MQIVMQNYSDLEIKTITVDSSVVVQGSTVFIDYDCIENHGNCILSFDKGSGKWLDESSGMLWDEFEVRPEGDEHE